MKEKQAVLEGLLFVVGEDGLDLSQISEVLEISEEESKELVSNLKDSYNDESRGLRIDFLGNKIKLTTKYEHKDYYKKLLMDKKTKTISSSAIETLAIIAYNEPITRVQIEALRGVSTVQIIRKLLSHGMIKEEGRANLPGRPILYSTTHEFLDYFGMNSLDDLPKIDELIEKNEEVEEEKDLYKSNYKEEEYIERCDLF